MRQRPTARTNVIITAGKGAKILFKNIQRTELNYYNRKKNEKNIWFLQKFLQNLYKKTYETKSAGFEEKTEEPTLVFVRSHTKQRYQLQNPTDRQINRPRTQTNQTTIVVIDIGAQPMTLYWQQTIRHRRCSFSVILLPKSRGGRNQQTPVINHLGLWWSVGPSSRGKIAVIYEWLWFFAFTTGIFCQYFSLVQ